MTMSEPPDRNVYAPPAAQRVPRQREPWTVAGVFALAIRVYVRTPLRTIIAVGLIPPLASLPLAFWTPVETWLIAIQQALYSAVYSLVAPGQVANAISLTRDQRPSLARYYQKAHLAPAVFLLSGAPFLLGYFPYLALAPGPQEEDLVRTALAVPFLMVALYLAFRFFLTSYVIVERNGGVWNAAIHSWRRTGSNWMRYLILTLLTTILLLLPGIFDWKQASPVGTTSRVLLTPIAELAVAFAYVSVPLTSPE